MVKSSVVARSAKRPAPGDHAQVRTLTRPCRGTPSRREREPAQLNVEDNPVGSWSVASDHQNAMPTSSMVSP